MAIKRYEVEVVLINTLTYSVFMEEDESRSVRKIGILALDQIRRNGDKRILNAEHVYVKSHKEIP